VRFVLDDANLTGELKRLRHDLAGAARFLSSAERHAVRDTPHDVGADIATESESRRADAWSVCQASLERAKQSLRSLEEFSKVAAPAHSAQFESLRYRLYTLEAAIGRTVDAIGRLAGIQLCILVDGRASEADFAALVDALIYAGVGMIQLRDKRMPVRQLVERARLLVARTRASAGTLAIINDRPAVAAAVDADGVHLGQEDFTLKDARVVLGPRKLIGVSTHSIEQARQAVLDGANYLGVGPVFPSATKQFDAIAGLKLVGEVAREVQLPAFAIGGVMGDNVGQIVEAGMRRVAVSSSVVGAPSPAVAAKQLLSALQSAI
jgi:thiamine-phosphate pyrophosphorylase